MRGGTCCESPRNCEISLPAICLPAFGKPPRGWGHTHLKGMQVNALIFAEWLRRQGHRVIRTASSYWYEAGPKVYQAFPYHWLIQPSGAELSEVLVQNRAWGLRYSTPIRESVGCISYHAVYAEPTYTLESLGKWARKNTRRGLSSCRVEPISFDRLAEEGWALQNDTVLRQGRAPVFTAATWHVCCQSAAGLPGFAAWGALVDGHLAASVITFQMCDWAYMLYQQCRREYLEQHVNNALAYVVTAHLLQQPDTRSVLYGLHSLDAPPSVDEFKFRMAYKAVPVRQRVVFCTALSLCANVLSHRLLAGLSHRLPGNSTLAKAEGMLRFHLEGRKPLVQQAWPQILEGQREAVCPRAGGPSS